MTSAPAFQFYVDDFLSGTTFLSAAATGAYIRMLALSWSCGPIPDSPAALCRAMGLSQTDPPFETVWNELRDKWHHTSRGWINPRLEVTRWQQANYRDSRANDGRRGAAKRWGNRGAIGYPMATPNETLWGNDSSPISDLQSLSRSPTPDQDQAPTEDRDKEIRVDRARSSSARARVNDSVWVEPHGNPHAAETNLVNGADLRRHGQHAWCAPERPNLCIPHGFHTELKGAAQKSDAEMKAWYGQTIAKFNGTPIGDDRFVFWRNELAGWIGTVTAAPPRRSTRAEEQDKEIARGKELYLKGLEKRRAAAKRR